MKPLDANRQQQIKPMSDAPKDRDILALVHLNRGRAWRVLRWNAAADNFLNGFTQYRCEGYVDLPELPKADATTKQ